MNNTNTNRLWIAVMTIGVSVISLAYFQRGLRQRIERLEDRSARTIDLISRHLELEHGYQFHTNETSITISNASEKTIMVTFPIPTNYNHPYIQEFIKQDSEAKEDKP